MIAAKSDEQRGQKRFKGGFDKIDCGLTSKGKFGITRIPYFRFDLGENRTRKFFETETADPSSWRSLLICGSRKD